MDDDHVLQCHLELMHALQTKRLRPVRPEEKPVYIGGLKTPPNAYSPSWPSLRSDNRPPNSLLDLQGEFVQQSLAMQERLRPQLERMAEIRRKGVDNDRWQETMRELRHHREGIINDGTDEDYNTIFATRREKMPPRLLFQLEETVRGMPGWTQLQEEIRQVNPSQCLDPVIYDGFYVIRIPRG